MGRGNYERAMGFADDIVDGRAVEEARELQAGATASERWLTYASVFPLIGGIHAGFIWAVVSMHQN